MATQAITQELRDWIAEVEQFWTGQLAAFQAYAEKRHAASTKPERTKPLRAKSRVRSRPAKRR